MIWSRCFLLFLLTPIVLCGCQRSETEPPRRVVEGNVTFNAAPVSYGIIRFIPAGSGAIATAIIENGEYRVSNKGGVSVGTSRIEVTSMQNLSEVSEDNLMSGSVATPVQIPDQFNTKSILQETIPAGTEPFQLNLKLQK